jgi:hypothetical protein
MRQTTHLHRVARLGICEAWNFISTPPHTFMVWCLTVHRDNFTFPSDFSNVTRIFKIIIILMVNRNGCRRKEMVTVYFKSTTTGFIWRNLENHENFLVKPVSVWADNETQNQTSTSYTLFLRVHIKYPYLPDNVVYLRLF